MADAESYLLASAKFAPGDSPLNERILSFPHPTTSFSHLNIDNISLKSNNGLGRNRKDVESKALIKTVVGRPSPRLRSGQAKSGRPLKLTK